MPTQITLIATFIAAVLIAQTVIIFKLQGELAEMRRTWAARNHGVLSPMPWPPAGEALVGEVVEEEYENA